jgi:hypothetical protein
MGEENVRVLTADKSTQNVPVDQATENLNRTKSTIVPALERVDRNPQFTHFCKLSPEIRNAVYELAIADTEPRMCPKTPAVGRVDR